MGVIEQTLPFVGDHVLDSSVPPVIKEAVVPPHFKASSAPSDSSVPPGFVVKFGAKEGADLSSSTPLVICNVASGSHLSSREAEDISSTVPEDSHEEGEFTPVVSKKTKKKSLLLENAKARTVLRAQPCDRPLLLKSAKFKRFK